MTKYDFDKIIDRRGTNALNTDGFRGYIFKADDSMKFPYEDDEFIRMWVADMEFQTSNEILEAIKDRVDHGIFGYTKVFDDSLYNAFVGWTKSRYGWEFSQDELFHSPGIIPALYELVNYITQPDEKIIIFTPSYAYFQHAVEDSGRTLVTSDLVIENGEYGVDFADLNEKLADEKISLCIFCNPHNPTGHVWSAEELEKIGNLLVEKDIWIISDEIHCDLLREGVTHTPFAKVLPDYHKMITCMSPSKTFNLAGLMFSNIVIRDEGLRQTWIDNHYDFVNPLSVAATQAAYEHGEEWLSQLVTYLDRNFDTLDEFLSEKLPKVGYIRPESTYLAWLDIKDYLPEGIESLPLYFANNAGVLLEGGDMFVDNSDTHIRLNLAVPKATLVEGLNRIEQLLKHPQV